jgi:hypothetical protein
MRGIERVEIDAPDCVDDEARQMFSAGHARNARHRRLEVRRASGKA